MRRVLKSEILKLYFDTAWKVLPTELQTELKSFIRQVREVESLTKTRIGCPDGRRYGPFEFGTGYTFFYKDKYQAFVDVILPGILRDFTEAAAVCVILHELAHAYEYATKHERAMGNVLSEQDAWDQALVWSKRSNLSPRIIDEIELCVFDAKIQETFIEVIEKMTSKERVASDSPTEMRGKLYLD